ncbi:MAG: ribonuclease H-like domain-containing protein, partial [Candidatus Limnocylindrales bacterium]
ARLRALDRRLPLATELPPAPRPAARAAQGPRRAERLAAALDGRVEATPAGSIVVTERRLPFPLDTAALGRLPLALDPARPLLLLDTETTGLGTAAGTVAFLVGLGRWERDQLLLRQLWLPDHPDEPALLAALEAEIPPGAWLVTYNGRSFDWPLLVTRFRLHRRAPPALAGHLDLLPVARQLWRHRLPDARLTSIEAGVAGIRRPSDLPGALVPERYFAMLRGAAPQVLRPVGEHNLADVEAMAHLLRILAERLADPAARRSLHPGDLAGLGRALRRQGRLAEAASCLGDALDAADAPDASRAVDRDALALERARLLGRLGRRQEARDALGALARRSGRTAVLAGIALAVQLEHREGDLPAALQAARGAAELQRRRRSLGLFLPEAERDLPRRLARLERRLQRPRPAPRAARG